jgi:exodeoxyribonuclease VII large subunit
VQRIAAERESLAHREQVVRAADPATALRRGFSLTLAADGTLVRSVEAVKAGEALTTRLSDGSVESVVRATRREALG